MKISEKLQKRVSLILGRSVEMPLRLYPGSTKKAGGWVWSIGDNMGSGDTMKECANHRNELTCSKINWDDIEFHAEKRRRGK